MGPELRQFRFAFLREFARNAPRPLKPLIVTHEAQNLKPNSASVREFDCPKWERFLQ